MSDTNETSTTTNAPFSDNLLLLAKSREQYLIGSYASSLQSWHSLSSRLEEYSNHLLQEMEHADTQLYEKAEAQYRECNKLQEILEEEFVKVKEISDLCSVFAQAPPPPSSASSSSQADTPTAAAAVVTSPDALAQEQHLADQRRMDNRDPDVWPPPTPWETPQQHHPHQHPPPAAHRQARRPPNGGAGAPFRERAASNGVSSASSAAPARSPPHHSPSSVTPPADDTPSSSAAAAAEKLPGWAKNPSSSSSSSSSSSAAAPPSRPPHARHPSNKSDPPAPRLQRHLSGDRGSSSSSSSSSSAKSAPANKPPVPKFDSKKKDKVDKDKDKSDKDNKDKEHKFVAANKEEQEAADLIESSGTMDRKPNTKWDDIAGLQQAKQLLNEAVVLPRLIPGYFTGLRRPPRGVLMFGPPGTGKTLLAKAVATECGTTFFNVTPSTFTSKWRGESEKLIKVLFEMARFYAPSTIFIDEVDGLCSARGTGGEHESSRRVKGELLQQMDGATTGEYNAEKSVMVLGATNLPWELDAAFLRRFEKRINIDLPDREGRRALFKLNTQGMSLAEDVVEGGEFTHVVDLSEGYSGADIAGVCRDASMLCLRKLTAGLTPDQIRQLNNATVPQATRADFDTVFLTVRSSAAKSDLQKYKDWMKEYGAAI